MDELEFKCRQLMAEWEFDIYDSNQDVVDYYKYDFSARCHHDALVDFCEKHGWSLEKGGEHLETVYNEIFSLVWIRKARHAYNLTDIEMADLAMEIAVHSLPEGNKEELRNECRLIKLVKEADDADVRKLVEIGERVGADNLNYGHIDEIKYERFGTKENYMQYHKKILDAVLASYRLAEVASGIPEELAKKDFWDRFLDVPYRKMFEAVHQRKAAQLFFGQ